MKWSTLTVLAITLCVRAADVSDVIVLTDSTFDAFVEEGSGISLIEFYAPWCGHCKTLAPEYEIAATSLKPFGIALAKVDCTVEKGVCDKLDVQGFPTLKLYRGGVSGEYKGPRVADGIVAFMKKQATPAVTVLADEAAETTFAKSEDVVIIGHFTSTTTPEFILFLSHAQTLRDTLTFGYLLTPSHPQQIHLHKKFDGLLSTLPAPITLSTLTAFIASESIPLVGEIGPDNYAQYVQRALPIGYFFYENDTHKTRYAKALGGVAEMFKGRVSIVWIDGVKYAGHGQSMNLLVYPGFVISDSTAATKYPYKGALEQGDLAEFVKGVLEGTVKASFKSQPVPVPNDGPVLTLVNENYESVVLDKSKDVFVELYAPWYSFLQRADCRCGHCKKLTPVWETLASRLGKTSDIRIVKMDMTENDLPANTPFTVEGFPTIKLYKAGSNEIVEYAGDRTLGDLAKFLRDNAVHGGSVGEDVGADSGTDADSPQEGHSEEL